jgi:hypothetical protein
MAPLLDLRRAQVGPLYFESEASPRDTAYDFLYRFGRTFGPVDPEIVPFYLLIVGEPQEISFEFQFNLDIQHAVGRVGFEQLDDYARFANNVVRAETDAHKYTSRSRAGFFGTKHPEDKPTHLSCLHLIESLAQSLHREEGEADATVLSRELAGKQGLQELLGGDATPKLLFSATHCMLLPPGHPNQEIDHGAPICAEWPGPVKAAGKPIARDACFTARDLDPSADLTGLITFMFGCCSGGAPNYSHFPTEPNGKGYRLARKPFIANLPKAMLSAPKGCPAVVGHIDSAYMWSFTDWREREQNQLYHQCFDRLLKSAPLGWAMQSFHEAYANRRLQFEEVIQKERMYGDAYRFDDLQLAQLWFSVNDLRNFLILGDPAVSIAQPKLLQKRLPQVAEALV